MSEANDDISLSHIWSPQPGPQAMAVVCPAEKTFFGGSRGGGKSLSISSHLLTPKGWKKFSEIKPGDNCIDPEAGGSQEVIGVYPQGEMDIYEITFDDGAKVHATLDHLWTYKCANRKRPGAKTSKQREYLRKETGLDTYRQGRYANFRVNTTEKLIEELEDGNHNPRIPLTAPVLFDVNGRTGTGSVPPYLIGLMLGDGTFSTGKSGNKCSSGDNEIRNYLRDLGFVRDGRPGFDFYLPTSTSLNSSLNGWANNHGLLGKTGKEKFIPGYIFTANVEYRLNVLRGLLDADGYVDNRGHIEFTSVSDHLVFGVCDLVRSFGGKATVSDPITGTYRDRDGNVVECQTYRRVYIQSDIASHFFTLKRKRDRCTDRWNGGHENMRKVVSIEYSHREEALCIKVSSPHGLFVADDYIVTHNTDCAIGRQLIGAMKYGHAWNGLFIRKNYKHFNELRRRIDELIRNGLPARRTGGPSQTNYIYFENGAQIMFTAIQQPDQLDFFMGNQYTEISVEEAPTFSFIDRLIDELNGCLRSPHGVACSMFLTGNPGGPGHSVIKRQFISAAPAGGKPITDDSGETRIFIPSNVEDNKVLLENDPNYKKKLESIQDPNLRKAWLEGDWDVVLGGFFDDIWDQNKHVVRYFHPPDHWDRVVGFDWGSARPFSVGWYAVSGGEFIPELGRALPRGSLVRFFEWYGCVKDSPNTGIRMESGDVAARILELERRHNLLGKGMVDRICDPACFKQEDGPSIAERMADAGVVWRRGDNKRIPGWTVVREYMRGRMVDWEEITNDEGEQEIISAVYDPYLYVTDNCRYFIELVPTQERDEKDPEDIDCFVGDTLVSTPYGEKPIETIQKGEYVNTPLGPKKVENNICNGYSDTHIIEMGNGRVLEGTPHHKIFHNQLALKPLCLIPSDTEENILLEDEICQMNLSDTEGYTFGENQEDGISSVITTLQDGMDSIVRYCTGLSLKTISERYLTDTMSTTETETDQTTVLRILNSSLRAIMQDYISKKELVTVTLPQIAMDILNGDSLNKEKFSFEKMLKLCARNLPKENLRALVVATLLERNIKRQISARNVGKNTRRQHIEKSALSAGQCLYAEAERWMGKPAVLNADGNFVNSGTETATNGGVKSVENTFPQKKEGKPAATNVVKSYAGKEKKLVYNLEIEQSRLYFAEKVLVSNTTGIDHIADELRYIVTARPGMGTSELDKKHEPTPMELEHQEIEAIHEDTEDISMPYGMSEEDVDLLKDAYTADDEISGII